jgi:hypothetical protein
VIRLLHAYGTALRSEDLAEVAERGRWTAGFDEQTDHFGDSAEGEARLAGVHQTEIRAEIDRLGHLG